MPDPNVKGCLLLCPLEGCNPCKQSAFLYQKAVRLQMTLQSASQSMTKPNIFFKTVNGSTLRVAIYVDNMLLSATTTPRTARH